MYLVQHIEGLSIEKHLIGEGSKVVFHTAGVSTVLALVLHFVLKTCGVHLHLPMLLLANLVSVPVEVIVAIIFSCHIHG